MGLTMVQKILAKKSGKEKVVPGEVVWAKPDLISRYDYRIQDFDIRIDPDRVALSIDHFFLANSEGTAKTHRTMRELAKKYGIHFYDIGRTGTQFQLLAEEGLVRPGMLIINVDSHVSTFGAFGTYSIGVGEDFKQALLIGEVWLKVPETLKVNVSGKFADGVTSRDLFERILGDIGPAGAIGQVVEYSGPAVLAMSIDSRMVLCNLAQFFSAYTALIAPDQEICDYVKTRSDKPFEALQSDSDAQYVKVLNFDVSKLEPMVAAPPDPHHVKTVKEVAGTEIDQAFIGTCACGRAEDLRLAARILRGRRVHSRVRFLIAPITPRIYHMAVREGLTDIFLEAGAVVGPPGCGACAGRIGYLLPGETCISTSTLNIPGRMGSPEANIYLASAATVAASAVEGRIADPRKFF